jgi:hypothetical protein
MALEKCIFAESYTDKKTGEMKMPERCIKKGCNGFDDPKNPKCEFFLPIIEDKKIIKKPKN